MREHTGGPAWSLLGSWVCEYEPVGALLSVEPCRQSLKPPGFGACFYKFFAVWLWVPHWSLLSLSVLLSEMGTVTINTCSPNSQCSAKVKCHCDGNNADDFALPLHSPPQSRMKPLTVGLRLGCCVISSCCIPARVLSEVQRLLQSPETRSIDMTSPDPAQCLPLRQQQLGSGWSGAEPGAMAASFSRQPRVLSPVTAWSCFCV